MVHIQAGSTMVQLFCFLNIGWLVVLDKKTQITETAPFESLPYKLFKSTEVSDDLSIVFHQDIRTREQVSTKIERIERNYHVRSCLKVIFDFAGHQKNALYGLGYKQVCKKVIKMF